MTIFIGAIITLLPNPFFRRRRRLRNICFIQTFYLALKLCFPCNLPKMILRWSQFTSLNLCLVGLDLPWFLPNILGYLGDVYELAGLDGLTRDDARSAGLGENKVNRGP